MNHVSTSLTTFGIKTSDPEPVTALDAAQILNTNSLASRQFERAILECKGANADQEISYRDLSDELSDAIRNHYNLLTDNGAGWLFGPSRYRMWLSVHQMLRLFHSDEKLAEVINRWITENCNLEPEYFISLIEEWEQLKDLPVRWATGAMNVPDLHLRERIGPEVMWGLDSNADYLNH